MNLDSRASDIRSIFDRIAPVYDSLNDLLSLAQHRVWKQMAIKWCDPKPGATGLDLCCGSGDLAVMLARQVGSNGKVFGVDFSCQLLAQARQRVENHYPPLPIAWVEADVLHLPFDNDLFDCATIGYGLRNVIDIPCCLTELHRVLKPGAKAAILDFHRPSNPTLQSFQHWYLQNLVVPAAQHFGLKEEYAYISPSLDRFPTGSEQVKLALQAGFTTATHYQLAVGMMGVLVITK